MTVAARCGYVGQHQKLTETEFSVQFIQMGERVYVPSTGRFAQVDPVEGGTDNNYVYVVDPVNDFDLNGTIGWKKWFNDRWKNTKSTASWTWKKRNQFVAWHKEKAPWLSNAVAVLAAARGGRGGGGGFATSAIARAQATKMGYRNIGSHPVKNSMGQPVYKKGNNYISRDITNHKPDGYWKMFNHKGERIGTYNRDLTKRIGD